MAKARISDAEGRTAVAAALGETPVRSETAAAVRYLLQELADRFPGGTLEVRVPPFGAVQCVEGPAHTRGTPPNVVEMTPAVWLRLASGSLSWADARADALVSASGTRATLEGMVPVFPTGAGGH